MASETVWIGKTVFGNLVRHYLFNKKPIRFGPEIHPSGEYSEVPQALAEQIVGREVGMLEVVEVVCTEVIS